MKHLKWLVVFSLLMFFALPAQANVLKESGRICFSDSDQDGFSETITFPADDHAIVSVYPDDPLGAYVGWDAGCNLPKSYAEFPDLQLTGVELYTTDENGCDDGELELMTETYPDAYKLYILADNCQYRQVLQTDVIVRYAAVAHWCPDARFAYEFGNAQIDNFINSPLLDYFAAQDDDPLSWVTVDLAKEGVTDFGPLIKGGQDFCAEAIVTQFPGVSCGGCDEGCGVESNGRMATAIAKLHYMRGRTAVCSDPFGEGVRCDRPTHLADKAISRKLMSGESPDLVSLMPDFDALGWQAFPVSPSDLTEVTNAVDVVAMDHFKLGNPNGSALLLETRQHVYEHTKTVCDRVSGHVLEHIMELNVRGTKFPVAVLEDLNEEQRSFVITFSVVDNTVVSRWRIDDYPQYPDADSVYNFQLWTCSLGETEHLLRNQLGKLEEVLGELKFDPSNKSFAAPIAYFIAAEKIETQAKFRATGRTTMGMHLEGRYWPEEDSETPVDFELELPNTGRAETDLPPYLDAQIKLVTEEGNIVDEVYLSDGQFTAFDDKEMGDGESTTETRINKQCERYADVESDDFMITGCAELTGDIERYAVVTRTIDGPISPFDMTAYEAISFEYNANTDVVMCLESKSRYGLPQNCVTLRRTSGWEKAWVDLADVEVLNQPDESTELSDITAISWNMWHPKVGADFSVRSVVMRKNAKDRPADYADYNEIEMIEGGSSSGGCAQSNGSLSVFVLLSLLTLLLGVARRKTHRA